MHKVSDTSRNKAQCYGRCSGKANCGQATVITVETACTPPADRAESSLDVAGRPRIVFLKLVMCETESGRVWEWFSGSGRDFETLRILEDVRDSRERSGFPKNIRDFLK